MAPVLEDVHKRLAGVVIENLDWREFIDRYNRSATLFYLDPPYWGSEGDYGRKLFDRSQFAILADCLARLRGRFILPVNDVPQICEMFDGFAIEEVELNTGRLATADQVVAYLGRFFRWAVEEEIIERSPMEGLRGRRRLESRERVLTVEELRDVWRTISDLDYPFGPLIQVLLLTGQRKGEVTGMRWDELRDWNAKPHLGTTG